MSKPNIAAVKADAGRIVSAFLKAALASVTATQAWSTTAGVKGIVLAAIVAGGTAALRALEALFGMSPSA